MATYIFMKTSLSKYYTRIILLVFLLQPSLAFANGIAQYITNNFDVVQSITDGLKPLIDLVIKDSAYRNIVAVFFAFFGFFRIVTAASYYIAGGSLVDLAKQLGMIAYVFAALLLYPSFIGILESFISGLGDTIQETILNNGHPMYPLFYIFELWDRIKFDMTSGIGWRIWEFLPWLFNSAFSIILMILLFIIMTAMFIVNVAALLWTAWGFTILAFLGYMTVPLILSERFSFIADGWLKIFITVLLFGLLARLATSLTIVGFVIILDIPTVDSFQNQTFEFHTGEGNIGDIFLLIFWGGLSTFGIRSSFMFASSMVSGMGSGIASPKGGLRK